MRSLTVLQLCTGLLIALAIRSPHLHAQTPTTTTLSVPSNVTSANPIPVSASILPIPAGDLSSNGIKFTWTSPNQPPQSTIAFPVTGYMGYAYIGVGPLTPGTYTVQAFYLGLTSTTPGGTSYLPSQSAPVSVTVTAASVPPSALTGQYAFLFQGLSIARGVTSASAAVGSFTADGQGNITTGVLDLVTSAYGYVHSTTMSGSYALDASGGGALTLRTPALGDQTMHVSSPYTVIAGQVTQHFVANLSGGPLFGNMQIERQNPADFSLSGINGAYNLRLIGTRPGNPPLLLSATSTLDLSGTEGFGFGHVYLDETVGTSAYLGVPGQTNFYAPDSTTGAFDLETSAVPGGAYPVCLLPSGSYNAYLIDSAHLFLLSQPVYPSCPFDVFSGTATQ